VNGRVQLKNERQDLESLAPLAGAAQLDGQAIEATAPDNTVAGAQAAPPRLLLIGPTPPPYHGVAMAMRALLDAPWQHQFSMSHLELADRRGIEHINQPDLHDVVLFVRQWLQLLRLLLRERPQVVYVPISQSKLGFVRDSLLIWPAYLSGGRIVLHLHGGNFRTWYQRRGWLFRAYVRAVLARAARMIVLGEALRPLFHGLIVDKRIAVVPNGIAGRVSRAGAIRSPGRRHRVLYLSTLSREKGVLVLLTAAARLEQSRQDIAFVLAGPWLSDGDRREANELISARHIQGAIHFTGLVSGEEKRRLFESADLFVFPGVQQEGQPLVVLEAMAAGLPVLFTDRGCLAETVVDGDAGLQIKVADSEDLAVKLAWLIDRPEETKRLGNNARRRYEALYCESQFLANMASVLAAAARDKQEVAPR
jgi:glycosyltransferase involved in cell wall biosynthesis